MKFFIVVLQLLAFAVCTAQNKNCQGIKDVKPNEEVLKIIKEKYPDYHIPALSEFTKDWCQDYENNQVPNYYVADVTGDGIKETIMLITKDGHSKSMLVVIRNKKPDVLETFGSEENKTGTPRLDYGIGIDPPGDKGDMDSEQTVTLKTNSISVVYFGQASHAYYWNGKHFEKIVTGD